jgi:predicted ATPase
MAAHNLPYYATPFVGRLTELSEITNRLNDPNCHLLTLVGPGGIGKTRLAIQATLEYDGQFANGVYFVPLQALNSADFLVSAIADTIGFQLRPGEDITQQLLDYLRERALLLILDNLEHLTDGVGLISEILSKAPQICVLATSRERLNLLEEWVFDVEGLGYPASDTETDIEAYDAVRLFIRHAQRLQANLS